MDINRKHGRNEARQPASTDTLGDPLGGDFNPGSMLPLAPVHVRCGDLEIDRAACRAVIAGRALRLTAREFVLLLYLVDRVNRVVRRSDLLAKIWTLTDAHGSNVVNVYVRRLRRKFGAHAAMIETIRGFGYCLRPALRT
jgi:DNA-binding response OmpR family regulator